MIPTAKHSPGTIYPNFSRIVNEHGVIEYGFDDNGAYVDDSYGSPDIRYTSFWWVDIFGAPDSYLHNDVSYSYGYKMLRSPDIGGASYTYFIMPAGNFNYDFASVYSYGIFCSPYTAGISIWNTYPDGSIVGYHDGYFDSYGLNSPDTSWDDYVYFVSPSGILGIDYDNYGINNSYGRTSSLRTTMMTAMRVM